MATIAALDVLLRLSMAEFTKGRTDAEAQLAKLNASIKRASTIAAGAFAAVGGGAMVANLTNQIHATMEAIDVNAKLSDRLGITTESLLGMQHAANLAGVDVASFNADIEKMVKNLGEAAIGGGPVADALNAMGLNVRDLAGQNVDRTLEQIADGIAAIENPAERAAMATTIFGKSGQALLNTLSEGADGLRKNTQEVKDLNAAYSRTDASRVEAALDAINRTEKALEGLRQKVAIENAPSIEAIAKAATKAVPTVSMLTKEMLLSLPGMRGMALGMSIINNEAKKLESAPATVGRLTLNIEEAKRAAEELAKSAANMNSQFQSPLEQLNERSLQISKLSALGLISSEIALAAQAAAEEAYQANDPIRRVINSLIGQVDALTMTGKELDVYRLKQANATEADIERVRALHQQIQGLQDAEEAEKTRVKNLEEATQTIRGLQKELDTLRVGQRAMEVQNLVDLGATDEMVQQAQALMGLIDAERAFQEAIDAAARSQEKLNDEMDRAQGRQAGNFEGFGPSKSLLNNQSVTVPGMSAGGQVDRDVRVDGFGKLLNTASSIDQGIKAIQDIGGYAP